MRVFTERVATYYKAVAVVAVFAAVVGAFVASAQPVEARKGDRVTKAFGANVHLRQRIVPSDWDEVLQKASDTGIDWAREEFNWDVIEPVNNTYSWTAMDAVVDAYQEYNIDVLGLLTYSSTWASSNVGSSDYQFYPPDIEAWRDYVAQVSYRYKGKVDAWEIWNEPNHSGFWKGTVEEYAELLQVAADEIHEQNPEARVVLGGLSGSDYEYLEQVLEAMDDPSAIDVIAFHPYRQVKGVFNYMPEETVNGLNTLVADIYNMKAVAGRYGHKNTPIWLTEVGYSTSTGGVSEADQAKYMMRLYTQAFALKRVRKVFWYSFTDTSSDATDLESNFGMYDDDFEPKEIVSAHQYLRENLDGKRFQDQTMPMSTGVDYFGTSQGWEFRDVICTEGTLDDRNGKELRVTYNFTGSDNCYAPVVLRKQLANQPNWLQLRVRGESDNTQLRLRIKDATGETFQYNLGLMPNEWVYHNVYLYDAAAHWGGNNDNWVDYPISLEGLVIDNKDGERVRGTVQVDDIIVGDQPWLFQYRFKKDNFDTYAIWSADSKVFRNMLLDGVGRISIKRWNKSSVEKEAYELFRAKFTRTVKFVQTQ